MTNLPMKYALSVLALARTLYSCEKNRVDNNCHGPLKNYVKTATMTKSSILILILSSKKQVNSQNSVYGI